MRAAAPVRSKSVDHDAARRLLTERNLAPAAFGHLTEAMTAVPFEALGPVKQLLKRYLSPAPWTTEDDDALAVAVGPGDGRWERPLAGDLTLRFGWADGRFGVRVLASGDDTAERGSPGSPDRPSLAATFDGPVVPEATPNPRTIRFAVGQPAHDGPSRWYESAAGVDDPRVARLFAADRRVANVLVGPDFVAVGLRRPDDWEELLAPMLAAVAEEFADPDGPSPPASASGPPWAAGSGGGTTTGDRPRSRLEQAWADLGALRPADPGDLAQVLAAAQGDDRYRRQVAANLLREADPGTAAQEWSRLVGDPVRAVRRAAVDAMVDAGRPELRPLLEHALADTDAWVRWKALRGLVELGPGASRAAIAARADDPDFRVRLEAAAALRAG